MLHTKAWAIDLRTKCIILKNYLLIIALFIALATMSFQAIKAAVANAVKSLRTE